MSGFLSRLATRIDTSGSKARMKEFKTGWPATASKDVKFYRSQKVQYRYRERGTGPTIVFSADPPVTLEMYDELFELYAPHFRVIAVELPAMGFSAPDKGYRFGFRETNDDIAEFVHAVAGEGAILAFSCVAGLGAVDVAVRYPDLVSRLVLIQTGDVEAFQLWKQGRDPKGVLAKPFMGQYVMKKIAPSRMPDWYDLVLGQRQRMDQFCACADESFKHGALWALASAYQLYLGPEAAIGRPDQPILAIWGLKDGSHPAENIESAKRIGDQVTHHTLPEARHFPELEDPEAVLKLIRDFLE